MNACSCLQSYNNNMPWMASYVATVAIRSYDTISRPVARVQKNPLSNKRSTILPKRSTICLKKPQICKKVHYFV